MKVFIINRKRLMIIAGAFITSIAALALALSPMNALRAHERKLPIYCVDKKDKLVSISFDAAWGNEQTPTLLDILKNKNVKATFFLVGFWAEKYPGIELIDMRSSGGDPAVTMSNIEDMAKAYPDFDVLIGIDAQGGPAAVTV